MSKFLKQVESKVGSKLILQGNIAFALGVVHAGYHAATGYAGTPSTEVIHKGLADVQDKMKVHWSVNEAVAVNVALGHSIAGDDTLVTMKMPGVFQAGDAITTNAFYSSDRGALVIYAATDYVPSSTQHVIDGRYFFSSARIPVLEPRTHQEMYEIPKIAADLSREFKTPVVVLASGILCHSEGLVITGESRQIERHVLPANMHDHMLLPSIARKNYNYTTTTRIPSFVTSDNVDNLYSIEKGKENWGIVVTGINELMVKEALVNTKQEPHLMTLSLTYPVPVEKIKEFSEGLDKLLIIEDGYRFVQEKLLLSGINVEGKDENSTITEWEPELVMDFLSEKTEYNKPDFSLPKRPDGVVRPPSICPGCPYRAFAEVVSKLKKQKKLYGAFGDIGCSTLLYFNNALDTCGCMGASDSMRQGMVISRPDMANRVISVIGDSCECHSGMDSTRNAVFLNTPGVKVVLDNSTTAMTGGQPAPSTPVNLAGDEHKFKLVDSLRGEGVKVVQCDAFNMKEIDEKLTHALDEAEKGNYSVLVIEGPCIQEVSRKKQVRQVQFNYDKCKNCGLCDICPGIQFDEDGKPSFTSMCTNCGSLNAVCLQKCPFDAIEYITEEKQTKKGSGFKFPPPPVIELPELNNISLPPSLKLAIRGIGGQGNLFFGKVLSNLALMTPYGDANIVKGDTHGMAQLGGSVISTFSCGEVYSPVFAPRTADVLVVMEKSELLRPEFIELLKEDGTIIINDFGALPIGAKMKDYPKTEAIMKVVEKYNYIEINALETAAGFGDKAGRSSNVVVLGLVSTLYPFNLIPEEAWLSALMGVSPTDATKSANSIAFRAGRKLSK